MYRYYSEPPRANIVRETKNGVDKACQHHLGEAKIIPYALTAEGSQHIHIASGLKSARRTEPKGESSRICHVRQKLFQLITQLEMPELCFEERLIIARRFREVLIRKSDPCEYGSSTMSPTSVLLSTD